MTPTVPSVSEVKASTDKLLDEIDQILAEVGDEIRAHSKVDEDKPYTLAMAMREGAAVTSQAIGKWHSKEGGQAGETCALSAAYLSVVARGYA